MSLAWGPLAPPRRRGPCSQCLAAAAPPAQAPPSQQPVTPQRQWQPQVAAPSRSCHWPWNRSPPLPALLRRPPLPCRIHPGRASERAVSSPHPSPDPAFSPHQDLTFWKEAPARPHPHGPKSVSWRCPPLLEAPPKQPPPSSSSSLCRRRPSPASAPAPSPPPDPLSSLHRALGAPEFRRPGPLPLGPPLCGRPASRGRLWVTYSSIVSLSLNQLCS